MLSINTNKRVAESLRICLRVLLNQIQIYQLTVIITLR